MLLTGPGTPRLPLTTLAAWLCVDEPAAAAQLATRCGLHCDNVSLLPHKGDWAPPAAPLVSEVLPRWLTERMTGRAAAAAGQARVAFGDEDA